MVRVKKILVVRAELKVLEILAQEVVETALVWMERMVRFHPDPRLWVSGEACREDMLAGLTVEVFFEKEGVRGKKRSVEKQFLKKEDVVMVEAGAAARRVVSWAPEGAGWGPWVLRETVFARNPV